MTVRPKTIQIFLPTGEPQGIRASEITTQIVQVVDVPRKLLSSFLRMDQSHLSAVYFLVGGSEQTNDLEVYVGQTGNLRARLADHDKKKTFWERCLIVVSKTNSMTPTHTLYLEWKCIQSIRDVGRYTDHNGTGGSRPHTPAPLEAECDDIFDTTSTLLATLGHPLFVPFIPKAMSAPDRSTDDDELFYCTGSDADGRGLFTEEGFVVLKGSSGRLETVPSLKKSLDSIRDAVIESGVYKQDGDRLVFQRNHLFNTPSRAAMVLMARSANGWTEWKNSSGRTLDEVKRQNLETTMPDQ